MRAISWIVANAIALAAAAWLFEGIRFDGPSSGQAELSEKLLPLLIVSVILFGALLVNELRRGKDDLETLADAVDDDATDDHPPVS